MSISLISKPSDFGRVNDTNRLTYKFSSSNYTQPNFQFQFELIYWGPSGVNYVNGDYNVIGYFNKSPDVDGTVEFNPSMIYRDYLTYDFNASITSLKECFNSAAKFELVCYEYYGEPPVRRPDGRWSGESGMNPPLKLYNGNQQAIPYDYIPLNPQGNAHWEMNKYTTTPVGEFWNGHFLTDFNEARLDNDDLYWLYFIGEKDTSFHAGRPTRIKYTFYYSPTPINNISNFLGINGELVNTASLQRPLVTGGNNVNLNNQNQINPSPSILSVSYYDTGITYTMDNTFMYYFPMSPYHIDKNLHWFGNTGLTNNWLYYKVDILSGDTALNMVPFTVFKKSKCGKYGKYRLAWLNPHGGFDSYTFIGKSLNEFKIVTSTYKKKMNSNVDVFNPYEAGERIYDKKVTEEVTVRTRSLTQKEAQSLMNLVSSTKVFLIQIYEFGSIEKVIGIPVIITSESINYPKKVNDKEIWMEIKFRYANQKIIPKD